MPAERRYGGKPDVSVPDVSVPDVSVMDDGSGMNARQESSDMSALWNIDDLNRSRLGPLTFETC